MSELAVINSGLFFQLRVATLCPILTIKGLNCSFFLNFIFFYPLHRAALLLKLIALYLFNNVQVSRKKSKLLFQFSDCIFHRNWMTQQMLAPLMKLADLFLCRIRILSFDIPSKKLFKWHLLAAKKKFAHSHFQVILYYS